MSLRPREMHTSAPNVYAHGSRKEGSVISNARFLLWLDYQIRDVISYPLFLANTHEIASEHRGSGDTLAPLLSWIVSNQNIS